MLAVFKKELKSYLLSPIGYVFIGLFLIMFSTFFFTTIFKSQVINFEYLFYNGATILTFITPVLTMRMFSEERKKYYVIYEAENNEDEIYVSSYNPTDEDGELLDVTDEEELAEIRKFLEEYGE